MKECYSFWKSFSVHSIHCVHSESVLCYTRIQSKNQSSRKRKENMIERVCVFEWNLYRVENRNWLNSDNLKIMFFFIGAFAVGVHWFDASVFVMDALLSVSIPVHWYVGFCEGRFIISSIVSAMIFIMQSWKMCQCSKWSQQR